MAALVCDIVTPQSKLYSDEAYMVVAPGTEGSMGYLHGHVPLVSALADGVVRVIKENGGAATCFALQGGYVQVTGEKVIILADRAVLVDEIDAEAVRAELAELQAKREKLSDEEAAKTTLAADIAWCNARLSAKEK